MNTYEVVIKYTHEGTKGNDIEGAAINKIEADSAIKAFNSMINMIKKMLKTEPKIYEVHIEEK